VAKFKKIYFMEAIIDTAYSQVFELISQLPEHDIQKLLKHLQIKFEVPKVERLRAANHTLGDFLGLLNEREHIQLKKYTSHARKEWDRTF